MVGQRVQYVRMKGGWGYGTIIRLELPHRIILHLDCQNEGEEWPISPKALGHHYFVC